MPRGIYWFVLSILVVVLALVVTVLYLEANTPGWDGTYRCDPGGTYTTEECP